MYHLWILCRIYLSQIRRSTCFDLNLRRYLQKLGECFIIASVCFDFSKIKTKQKSTNNWLHQRMISTLNNYKAQEEQE